MGAGGSPGPDCAGNGASIGRSRLFIKYVGLFIAVVSLALVANGVFDVYFSYQEQKASLVRIQREQAEAAAGKIGQFISEIESQVGKIFAADIEPDSAKMWRRSDDRI
jgi:two-component system, NtrC family, sensor kinase